MDLSNKSVLVVGAARSGIAAARLLKSKGARVTLADCKDVDFCEEGIETCFGRNADAAVIKKQQLIIQSPGVPLEMETFAIARENNIEIMGEMELAFLFCQSKAAAITGTNGKTTTAALTGEIIGKYIKETRVVGNIGLPFSEVVPEIKESDFTVIEASSFQLEHISWFKPNISAILNIVPDHLDRHKTMEAYIEAKTNIFKLQDKNCCLILNYDDPILRALKIENSIKILWFSVKDELEEGAYLRENKLILKIKGEEEKLVSTEELKILGMHNVENALASALIAHCAGAPLDIIREGLREFQGVTHRIEFVRELASVKYYNDSKATNPEAAIKALCSMKGKTVLIAGGYDKGSDFDEFAELFNERLSHLIVLGKTRDKIIASAKKAGFGSYTIVEDYEEAVNAAKNIAKTGENVLLSPACASWDMFKDYEERGESFKSLVRKLK